MEPFKDKATAETLASANSWVSKRQISADYQLARIVTERPWTAKYVEVPRTSVAFFRKPHDFFVIYTFSAKDKLVEFAGFWTFDLKIRDNPKRYANIRFYNNKRLHALPVKPASYEMKASAPPRSLPAPVPAPMPKPTPRYFDFEHQGETTIDEAARAIRRRLAAFQPSDSPDVEFMELSTKEAVLHNMLSFCFAAKSSVINRDEWADKEVELLDMRLRGCTDAMIMELYQKLLPAKRKSVQLRMPTTGFHWQLDEDGTQRMLSEEQLTDADRQMLEFSDKKDVKFIEMPFEEVPPFVMKLHDLILYKGQAFVPFKFIKSLVPRMYRKFIMALPKPDPQTDKRMLALLRLWDSRFLLPTPGSTALDGKRPSIADLSPPLCVTDALKAYPDYMNRRFLTDYVALLGQPLSLLWPEWDIQIAKKYPSREAAAKKKVTISKEVNGYYRTGKMTDYHGCKKLMRDGKCPFYVAGITETGALDKCWGNPSVQGFRSPVQFTRAREQQRQEEAKSVNSSS